MSYLGGGYWIIGEGNGHIDAPENIYNTDLKKWYLFIAYDGLSTKYNTRVCRADTPTGPFYGYDGIDANANVNHGPVITAPDQFGACRLVRSLACQCFG